MICLKLLLNLYFYIQSLLNYKNINFIKTKVISISPNALIQKRGNLNINKITLNQRKTPIKHVLSKLN